MINKLGISAAGLRRIARVLAQSEHSDVLTMSLEEFQEQGLPGFRYDPHIENEANANDPKDITLGYKFFDLDPQGREHVIAHEKAHYLVDTFLADSSKWGDLFGLVDAGGFGPKDEDGYLTQGVNGQFTPLENLTEAVTVFQEDSEWLQGNYPLAYDFVQVNFPEL